MANLSRGSSGSAVTALQHGLNAVGAASPPLTIDGQFGPLTETAVKTFQGRAGLTVDGVVGPNTADALNAAIQALRTSAPQNPALQSKPLSTGPSIGTILGGAGILGALAWKLKNRKKG